MATTPRLQTNLSARERAALAALRADRLGQTSERVSGFKSASRQQELRFLDSGLTAPEDLAALLDPTDASPEEFLDNLKKFSSDIQVDWDAINLTDLPGALGDGVRGTLDTLNSVIEVLKQFVSLVKAGLELVALVASLQIDILKTLFQAAILALEAVIDVFYSTSASILRVVPSTIPEAHSVNRTLFKIAESYDNKLDVDRPVSRSNSDIHVFVFFMSIAPDLTTLTAQVKNLLALFDTTEIEKIFSKAPVGAPDYPNFLQEEVLSSPYNWDGVRLSDIDSIRTFLVGVKGVIQDMATSKSRLDMVTRAIELVIERLASIESQINSILDSLEIFANIFANPINTLTLYGPGSVLDVQTALRGAAQLETSPIKDFRDQELCAGLVFHSVLGVGRSLDFLRFIFQIRDVINQKAETVLEPASERLRQASDSFDARRKSESDQLKIAWKSRD